MALQQITNDFGHGGSGLYDDTLRDAVKELQRFKLVPLAGTTANNKYDKQ